MAEGAERPLAERVDRPRCRQGGAVAGPAGDPGEPHALGKAPDDPRVRLTQPLPAGAELPELRGAPRGDEARLGDGDHVALPRRRVVDLVQVQRLHPDGIVSRGGGRDAVAAGVRRRRQGQVGVAELAVLIDAAGEGLSVVWR